MTTLSRRVGGLLALGAATSGPATLVPADGALAARTTPRCRRRRCTRGRGHLGGHRFGSPPKKPTQPPAVSNRYAAIPRLDAYDRLIATRFSGGLTPALATEISGAGGGERWFNQQVHRARRQRDDGFADWWPELHQTPAQAWARHLSGQQHGHELSKLVASREMARRIGSPHQVLEAMAEFWHHHLHVPCDGGGWFPWRADYTDVLRRQALGRFDRMLLAAAAHPAMLSYLDVAGSTKEHPNENLARELLELHTVGAGHYSESDVRDCARLLTGYVLPLSDSRQAGYDTRRHWTGPVRILGFTHSNQNADGRAAVAELLTYLARHPLTAQRVALRLAQWFVADEPPASLVNRLATTFVEGGTAITPVLQSLIRSGAFKRSEGQKLRDPVQDVVATYRALEIRVRPPTSARSTSILMRVQSYNLGMAPMAWRTPEGAPLQTSRWASPARALGSFALHWDLAARTTGADDISYPPLSRWFPRFPLRVSEAADILCRQVLGFPVTPEILDTLCWVTQSRPRDVVGTNHRILTTDRAQVLALLLDHPSRFHR